MLALSSESRQFPIEPRPLKLLPTTWTGADVESESSRNRTAQVVPTTGVNVVLNAILISLYGLTGAAIATALGLLMWNVILLRLVYRRLQMNPTVFRVFGAQ